jgi:hypothetical protein
MPILTRDGGEQFTGIGMLRIGEDLHRGTVFYNLTQLHHRDPINYIIFSVLFYLSQRSPRTLLAQRNFCCTYFIGAVNYCGGF